MGIAEKGDTILKSKEKETVQVYGLLFWFQFCPILNSSVQFSPVGGSIRPLRVKY